MMQLTRPDAHNMQFTQEKINATTRPRGRSLYLGWLMRENRVQGSWPWTHTWPHTQHTPLRLTLVDRSPYSTIYMSAYTSQEEMIPFEQESTRPNSSPFCEHARWLCLTRHYQRRAVAFCFVTVSNLGPKSITANALLWRVTNMDWPLATHWSVHPPSGYCPQVKPSS